MITLCSLSASRGAQAEKPAEYTIDWLPQHLELRLQEQPSGVFYTDKQFQQLLWIDRMYTESRRQLQLQREKSRLQTEALKISEKLVLSSKRQIDNERRQKDLLQEQMALKLKEIERAGKKQRVSVGVRTVFIGLAVGLMVGYFIASGR